jgi:hypothetical protein
LQRPAALQIDRGLARVGEDLVHQLRRVFGGGADPAQGIALGRLGPEIRERHPAVAEDHREQVVEVVGDATCEHPEALELLRVLHMRLELAPFVLGSAALRQVSADQPEDSQPRQQQHRCAHHHE